jgi:hypothetical protein
MRMGKTALMAGFFVGVFSACSAEAAPMVSIELKEAGFAKVVVDATNGVATFDDSYGTFGINVTTGIGRPATPASAGIDLNSVDIKASGKGILSLFVTETGLRGSDVAKLFNGQIGGTFKDNVDSVVYSAFADNRNRAFGEVEQIGSTDTFTDSPFKGTLSGVLTDLDGLYSITEQVTINATRGFSEVSFDAQLTPGSLSSVPLPASAPMFGAALVALGVVGYGLKRKTKVAAAA